MPDTIAYITPSTVTPENTPLSITQPSAESAPDVPLAGAQERLAALNAVAGARLPPPVSRRRGLLARAELWFKQRARAATHWFTWEQTNFNRVIAESVHDLTRVLAECGARQAHVARQTDEAFAAMRNDFDRRLTELEAQVAELIAHTTAELRAEQQLRLNELLNEHRASFKQLHLQLSETATFADRSQRYAQMRFDEITRRMESLLAGQGDLQVTEQGVAIPDNLEAEAATHPPTIEP